MERMKAEGKDILKPAFKDTGLPLASAPPVQKLKEVSMVKEGVNRVITMEELKAHSGPDQPWFVVAGEGELPFNGCEKFMK
jgi:nitrate reductase (NAD(P)H)